MKKWKASFGSVLLAVFLVTGTAMALSYSPTPGMLSIFDKIAASNNNTGDSYPTDLAFHLTNVLPGSSTKYTDAFRSAVPLGSSYDAWVEVGLTGLNLDLTGYSALDLAVMNTNENPWTFQLFVNDGGSAGPSASAAVTLNPYPLGNGPWSLLSVDLTSLDAADIDDIYVRISAHVPLGPAGTDYTAEWLATPVPEPATMLLLGSGLIGLAGLGRRRLRKG